MPDLPELPSSARTVFLAVFALLPAVIASATFRRVADLRWERHAEDRRGALARWAALWVAVTLAWWRYLGPAIARLYDGSGTAIDIVLVFGAACVGPWLVALVLGRLARSTAREKLEALGFVSGRVTGPWDRFTRPGGTRMRAYWRDGRERLRAVVVSFAHDEREMLVDDVEVHDGTGWAVHPLYTGVMFMDGGKVRINFSQHTDDDATYTMFVAEQRPSALGALVRWARTQEPFNRLLRTPTLKDDRPSG